MKMKTMEDCQFCGHRFESRRHRYRRNWSERLFSHPIQNFEDQLDWRFAVRCPSCCNAYVSDTLKQFGILNRRGVEIFIFLFAAGMFVFAMLFLI